MPAKKKKSSEGGKNKLAKYIASDLKKPSTFKQAKDKSHYYVPIPKRAKLISKAVKQYKKEHPGKTTTRTDTSALQLYISRAKRVGGKNPEKAKKAKKAQTPKVKRAKNPAGKKGKGFSTAPVPRKNK